MLKKLISIKSVGAFQTYSPKGDVTLRAFTAIWGPNGVGKSTLCDVLRSFSAGDPAPLVGRRSLGGTSAPEVELLFDAGKRSFRGGSWDTPADPRFHIFDSCYVHENVYVGDFVEHDQKRSLYRVIVGEAGVALAAKVDSLDERLREVAKLLGSSRDAIVARLPRGLDIETFLALRPDPAIQTEIEAKEKEVAVLRQGAAVVRRPLLSIVEMPALPQEVDDVLRTTVDGLGAEAEKLVRAHIANAHTREGWLSEGLPVVQGDRCPFCGQDVTGSALIAAFRGFFSQGYGALKEKVAALQQRVSSSFGAPILERLKAQLARNLELGQEWQVLVGDTWDRALDLGPFEAVRDLILSALRTKETTPLEAQGPVLTAPPALAFEALRVSVAAYNTAAEIYNSKISATKERARTGQLDTSLAELAVLRSKEARFQEPLATASEESKNHSNTRDTLEREKAKAKAQLDGFAANVLSGSQASINRFLQKFGADFRIKKLERKYAGGTPSSSYFLEIDNVLVDLGDRKTHRSEPSFRNTLSAGDRSALALAFFLAQLEHDPELSKRVVVFDDPFTSQDRARRLCTQQEIRRAHQRAMQVIVLSHDEAFLADCCSEGLPPAVVKTLQLRKTITGPTLEEWDPSQPRGQALGDFQRLKNFLAEGGTGGASGLRDVARTIRPLLEAVLRARFLDKFTEGQWLGDMIQLLRDNHATLPEGLALPQELGEVNEYSKRYHHAQNPGADTEPIDEAELKTYVERAVLLAGGFW